MTDEACREFRDLMVERVRAVERPYELAFSGGVDSATMLFASLEAGYAPRLLTFRMEGVESGDARAARSIAGHFGLEQEEVVIPSDAASLERDARRVLPYAAVMKKVIVQCLIPWLYLYPAMRTGTILSGVTADDYYCNQRKVQVELHKHGEAAIMQYRRSYASDLSFSTANILRFAGEYGKRNVDVYDHESVERFFLRFPARALNRPYAKHISIRAFADYYRQGAWRRERASYQVNSGLRDLHDALLRDPARNPRGHKAVVALYREWRGTEGEGHAGRS